MLGGRVVQKLSNLGHDVFSTIRPNIAGAAEARFDVLKNTIAELVAAWPASAGYVVNCIGVIKPRIDESQSSSVEQAVRINTLFPHQLANYAENAGLKVLQIATDCVFSGAAGRYNEKSAHDATDVYGKTKSLGEVNSRQVMHLRCSIVGPEIGRSTSLWEWVRGQPRHAVISGYLNHYWNGITTDAFGEICHSIISNDLFSAGVVHVVPDDVVSKNQLVNIILKRLGRTDVGVTPVDAVTAIDRTLITIDELRNSQIWAGTSFGCIPQIQNMIDSVRIPSA